MVIYQVTLVLNNMKIQYLEFIVIHFKFTIETICRSHVTSFWIVRKYLKTLNGKKILNRYEQKVKMYKIHIIQKMNNKHTDNSPKKKKYKR